MSFKSHVAGGAGAVLGFIVALFALVLGAVFIVLLLPFALFFLLFFVVAVLVSALLSGKVNVTVRDKDGSVTYTVNGRRKKADDAILPPTQDD